MRYENLRYGNDILPMIFRYDSLYCHLHSMYFHWHDAVEILWITQGSLRIYNGNNRVAYTAKAGELVCVHAGHMHLYEAIDEQCRYYCIIFPQQALDSRALYQSALPRSTDDAVAKAWMEQLVDTLKARAPFYREKGRGLLAQLYVRLAQLGGEEQFGQETRPTLLVKSTMEYINNHFSRSQLNVEQIAAAVGVSRSHLCHTFKAVTGQTVNAYLHALRCDRARRYLQDGATVAVAAERAGFSSHSYFTCAYRRHFGILPSKDRQR